MKRLTRAAVFAIAMSTAGVPLAAEAQSRHDRREWREDRREWRQDRRTDHRDWRRDRRDDRRDLRRGPSVHRWDRHNPNWWRGRAEFRAYAGPRAGYWFAPGYGYHRVEPRYARYRWQRGHVLPAAYRGYYVRDPYFYGLRPAPRGYRWVHANNDLLLVALATGVIAEVVLNVF